MTVLLFLKSPLCYIGINHVNELGKQYPLPLSLLNGIQDQDMS